ncbi:hypothetical protein PHMEG_00018956 [Phytophthora megakarya]|uniref:Chromo domain-containing protein n=1 Tax=Phytophthora megakarya TaxID=4795 RepID=A0A225VT40_9STRA|nr:hypothetical protein PHMEG_00018956 [Phytophthora megakarya]
MSRLRDSFNVDGLRHSIESPDRFVSRPLPKVSSVHFAPGEAGDGLHILEALIKRHIRNRQPDFLVKWKDLDATENTGERQSDIRHAMHWDSLLRTFRENKRVKCRGRM